MLRALAVWFVTAGTLLPLLYYLVAVFCAWRFFRAQAELNRNFCPPVSILKPVCGLDRAAYANFARLCRLDYPDYEILFGVSEPNDPVIPLIEKLIQNFPQRSIRLLMGSPYRGSNDKVRKLCHLVDEARHDILVIADSDVRAGSDYLRAVVAPFQNHSVGAVSCMYQMKVGKRLGHELEAIGLSSDFLPSVIVARQFESVKFALGATMAVRRDCLAEIGGFPAMADCLSDDFELGCRIAAKGHCVELIPYTVWTLPPPEGMLDFIKHQLRWAVSVRNSRPWGHFGRILTQGLPWSVAASVVYHSWAAAGCFLGTYLVLRLAMAWAIGVRGLQDYLLWKKWWLIPFWDAFAFSVWVASFAKRRIHWRGADFYVHKGRLTPVITQD